MDKNPDPELAGFKSHGFEDPFLSNPSGEDEQLVPIHDTHHIYSISHEQMHNAQLQQQQLNKTDSVSGPYSNGHSPYGTHPGRPHGEASPTAHQDFLSPTSGSTENSHGDFSGYSSGFDSPFFAEDNSFMVNFGAGELLCINPQDITLPPSPTTNHHSPHLAAMNSNGASHLLSPVMTNTPSPSAHEKEHPTDNISHQGDRRVASPASIVSGRPSKTDVPTLRLPTLSAASSYNNLQAADPPHVEPPPSPIVKISSYSRGDSPSREAERLNENPGKRRASLSSGHLAPADTSPDDSDEEGASNTPKTALRADDGSWLPSSSTGLAGLGPESRADGYIPSLKEIVAHRELEEKNAEVENWLVRSETNGDITEAPRLKKGQRRRAISTGNRLTPEQQIFNDSGIPGPGALIEEETGAEDEDDEDSEISDNSPPRSPTSLSLTREEDQDLPTLGDEDTFDEEPLPSRYIWSHPWENPPSNSHFGDTKTQPGSSSAAISRFLRRAENFDTASRRATWGTDRFSQYDVESIIGPNSRFGTMKINDEKKEKVGRRSSFLEHASRLLPRRTSSTAKRKHPNMSVHSVQSPQRQTTSKSLDAENSGSNNAALPQRKHSFTRRSRSPSTGGALLEMGKQIASVGAGGSVEVASPKSASAPWPTVIKRRSRSEVPKGLRSPGPGGLLELMTAAGGPPIPTLASPAHEKPLSPGPLGKAQPAGADDKDDDDDEDDEIMDDKGVVMDFPFRTDPIVPDLDGFKTHVRQLNPRLEPALVERIAQEQLRRYKKMVELKVKHTRAVSQYTCTAGKYCFAQGGDAKMLPPRVSPKDPDATYAQFQVPGMGTPEEEKSALSEGAVTAALFAPGVPLPPVKRLPAEFECSLCFKVKKFQKPSDWTKHVHEDIQPFTCTFPECNEPKSFKRKADWVRHENERHRHLEWWTCSMADCPHTCYRKDNFVQHLVREHKMPEPKTKTPKSRSGSSKNPANPESPEVEQVWQLVESCRHVTQKQPTEEACRFCGNVCNSWKKLTVHMAKHMEQIAMPVLEIVKQRTVSAGTIISPIDGDSVSQLNSSINSTPVEPFSASSSDPSFPTPPQGKRKNKPAAPVLHGTAALVFTEAFSVPQGPSSERLRMHDQLQTTQRGRHSSSSKFKPYNTNTASYPRVNSPLAMEQGYTAVSQEEHYAPAQTTAATYPPPFNAVPRLPHPVPEGLPSLAQTSSSGMPYGGLESAYVPTSGFDGPQMFTSPVDSYQYYAVGQENVGQPPPPGSMVYSQNAGGMGYPIMQEPVDPSTGQPYIQRQQQQQQQHQYGG